MEDIAVVSVTKNSLPSSLEELKKILIKNGLKGQYEIEDEFLKLSNSFGDFEFSLFSAEQDEFGWTEPGIDIAGDFIDEAETIIELQEIFETAFPDSEFSCPFLDDDFDMEWQEEESPEIDNWDNNNLFENLYAKIIDLGEMLGYRGVELNVKERNEYGNFTNKDFESPSKIKELESEFIKIQDPFQNVNLAVMNPLFEAYFAWVLSNKMDGYIDIENQEYVVHWKHKSGENKQFSVKQFCEALIAAKQPIFTDFIINLKK
ncbi:MAG: hypothetical protein ACWA41_06580 [Putridiphycobacter sp.]